MLFVPKMPALGLLLEYPIFASYNRKVEAANGTMDAANPDYRPPIDFEPLREQMENFKQEFIYSNMRSVEDRDGMCAIFLCHVNSLASLLIMLRYF